MPRVAMVFGVVVVVLIGAGAAGAADPQEVRPEVRQETREEIERFLANTPAKTPAEVDLMVRGTYPGFRFGYGDRLVNVNNGAEVGIVVRTEPAHTFRDGQVGRAYIIVRPSGAQEDMVADVLERRATKR
jgi:hypothetical protein